MTDTTRFWAARSTSTSGPNGSFWQSSSYFAGKNRRSSTKEESLSKTKEIAEDWYLQLRGKLRAGEIKDEKTFREVSEHYLREFDIMTQGQRNQRYVEGRHWRSEGRIIPFFGNLGISEITAGKIQEYRLRRHQEAITKYGKPPGPQHTASGNRDSPPNSYKRRCAMDGWIVFPTSLSHTGNRPESRTVHGSHQKNTNNATKRHELVPKSRSDAASNGKRSNSTIMSSSQ
jgi:hypothetical protein